MSLVSDSSQAAHLHILVFGAGAIGTYIGGSLALSGHLVAFIEQEKVASGLRQRGLRLNMNGLEHYIPRPVVFTSVADALEKNCYNIAVFALKSYDTLPALAALAPYAPKLPPLLCLQNGVENEPALETVLGAEKVIAGSVTSSIRRRAAGDILVEKERGVGISSGYRLSKCLMTAISEAGLHAKLYSNPADMKWSKMLTNLLGNATSAILDMTPSEIFAHPGLYQLEVVQLREALAVMARQGIKVVDLPRTPVRALAFAVERLPVFISRPILQRGIGSGRGAKMPSFHIDLHSGSGKSEVDYLNGAVARYGARFGIPTPANRLLNETLLALTRGEQPIDTYSRQPEKLLRDFSRHSR